MKRTAYKAQKIDEICLKIAFLRAQGRCQTVCGRPAAERHHIFDGKWKTYWQLWTDHHFQVALCHHCHQIAPFAPHVDNKLFLVKLEDGLKRFHQGEHWTIIKAQHTALYDGTFLQKARTAPEPDYDVIYNWLVEEYKELESTEWMNFV